MSALTKEIRIRNAVDRLVIQQIDNQSRSGLGGPKRKLQTAYVLDRIFAVARTGTPWRHLDVQNGSPKTIFHHFNVWSKQCIF